MLLTLLQHTAGLLAAVMQFVAVTGLGGWLVARCGIAGGARRVFLWSALSGTVLLGLMLLALAALHVLQPLTLGLLWLALLPALPRGWRLLLAALPRSVDWLALPGVLLALALLAAGMTPPAQYDQLAYHLSAPQAYLQAGGLVPLAGNVHVHFPLLGSFTALPFIALAPAAAVSVWFYLLALLFLPALESLLAPLLRLRWRWLLRWLLLSSPLFAYFATQVAYDLVLATLVFAGLDLWRRLPARRALLPAGLLLGGALSLKYTSVLYVLPALLLMLLARPRAWRQLAAVVLLAAAILAPWLLRNLRDTGNPLAPFEFSLPHSAAYTRFIADAEEERSLADLPRWWLQVATLRYEPLVGALPPLALLALLPAGAWCWRQRRRAATRQAALLLLLAAAVQGLWITLAGENVRLVFPALLLAAAAVIALAGQRRRRPAALKALAAIIGLLQLALLLLLFPFMRVLPMAGLGLLTDEEYLTAVCINPYFAAQRAAGAWPVPGTLLITGECRSYYWPRPCIVSSAYDEDQLTAWTRAAADPAALRETLRRHGVTMLYYGLGEGSRLKRGPLHDPTLTAGERQRCVETLQRYTRIIGTGEGWVLAVML